MRYPKKIDGPKKQVSFQVSIADHKLLLQLADIKKTTITNIIRHELRHFLDNLCPEFIENAKQQVEDDNE